MPVPGSPTSLPVFPFPEPAARALAVAHRYAVLRDRPVGGVVSPDGLDRDGVRKLVDELLSDSPADGDGRWLTAAESADILHGYGIRVCDQGLAASATEAVAAAVKIGFPVALKIARGDVVHKTEVGGVNLGLADELAVAEAYVRVVTACGDDDPRVLVQQMLPTGAELIVGAVQDQQFGPVVMLGAGGVLSDLLADRTFRIMPLTDSDAADMIDRLRMSPLLDGFRGRPIVSRDAVRDLLHRVAAMVEDMTQIAELDLNPVVCIGADVVAVDAKIRLAPAAARPDTLVRQLH
ncbi:MAG: acetate--CoA ligase family protein [Geodermatophilaceae bacterium]